MADALTITGTVIAIVTISLQSIKSVRETLYGLRNGHRDFDSTEQCLQNLDGVLKQILRLAGQSEVGNNGAEATAPLTSLPSEPLGHLLEVVQRCKDDMLILAGEVKKAEPSRQKNAWLQKHTGTLSLFLKTEDLAKIRLQVSSHIGAINSYLGLVSWSLQLDQREISDKMRAGIAAKERNLSEQIMAFGEFGSREMARRFDEFEGLLGQQGARQDSFVANLTSAGQLCRDSIAGMIDTVQSNILGSLEKQAQFLRHLHDAQQLLQANANGDRTDIINDQISKCIDWLYTVCKSGKSEFDPASEEAQLITDNLTEVLQALLEDIDSTSPINIGRKRKRLETPNQPNEETRLTHYEARSVKRMRGILESSQKVQIRPSNWRFDQMPIGRRLWSNKGRVIQTAFGALVLVIALIDPKPSSKSYQESAREVFAGNLTLVLSRSRNKAKLRTFFVQRVLSNGAFTFSPTISFHAMIPNDSQIFDLVRRGDVDHMIKLLEGGLASLNDCDEDGHSLLWVSK
ncbi:MAG: hypothetical protein Q9160_005142 [Pyrenula sp. 1 TL-2023]